MLDKRRTYNENKVTTIIGEGTSFVGEIRSEGTIRIEGSMTGRVQCEDTIVVHDSGKVKADLVGGQIIVRGQVEGDVFAHDRLEVMNQARVIGNVTTPRLSIAEGVTFQGRCTMKAPGEAKPPNFDSPIVQFPKQQQQQAAPRKAVNDGAISAAKESVKDAQPGAATAEA